MKKVPLILFLLLITFIFLFTGCGSKEEKSNAPIDQKQVSSDKGNALDKGITLKFANFLPETHTIVISGDKFWMKRVEELTNGQVNFKYYSGGQLGPAKDMLEMVQDGAVDVTMLAAAYEPAKIPLSGVGELPGLFDNALTGSKAMWKIAKELLQNEEFSKLNIRILFTGTTPPYDVINTKREIKKPSDLKGLKIRGPGGIMDKTISLTGATVVSLPMAEVYEGLRRGVVDGTVGAYTDTGAYKFDEIIKYGTYGLNYGTVVAIWVMNEKVWQNLPDNVKRAIEQAGNESVENFGKSMQEKNIVVMKEWENKGKKVYKVNPDEQKEWARFFEPVRDMWVEEMEKKGLSGKKVLGEFIKAVQVYAVK